MTDRFKEALDAIGCMKLIDNRSVKHLKGTLYYKHYDTIIYSLTIATEAEQLRDKYTSIGVTLAARNTEIAELKAKLEKAKDALRMYSHEVNYIPPAPFATPPIDSDRGQRARTTLEELTKK